ncbi:hypothetical protein LTR28_007290 [Elasticomyces elasticus]|nr:hypothetical protein LTR28_007290 [Elasticomyces elasticus]
MEQVQLRRPAAVTPRLMPRAESPARWLPLGSHFPTPTSRVPQFSGLECARPSANPLSVRKPRPGRPVISLPLVPIRRLTVVIVVIRVADVDVPRLTKFPPNEIASKENRLKRWPMAVRRSDRELRKLEKKYPPNGPGGPRSILHKQAPYAFQPDGRPFADFKWVKLRTAERWAMDDRERQPLELRRPAAPADDTVHSTSPFRSSPFVGHTGETPRFTAINDPVRQRPVPEVGQVQAASRTDRHLRPNSPQRLDDAVTDQQSVGNNAHVVRHFPVKQEAIDSLHQSIHDAPAYTSGPVQAATNPHPKHTAARGNIAVNRFFQHGQTSRGLGKKPWAADKLQNTPNSSHNGLSATRSSVPTSELTTHDDDLSEIRPAQYQSEQRRTLKEQRKQIEILTKQIQEYRAAASTAKRQHNVAEEADSMRFEDIDWTHNDSDVFMHGANDDASPDLGEHAIALPREDVSGPSKNVSASTNKPDRQQAVLKSPSPQAPRHRPENTGSYQSSVNRGQSARDTEKTIERTLDTESDIPVIKEMLERCAQYDASLGLPWDPPWGSGRAADLELSDSTDLPMLGCRMTDDEDDETDLPMLGWRIGEEEDDDEIEDSPKAREDSLSSPPTYQARGFRCETAPPRLAKFARPKGKAPVLQTASANPPTHLATVSKKVLAQDPPSRSSGLASAIDVLRLSSTTTATPTDSDTHTTTNRPPGSEWPVYDEIILPATRSRTERTTDTERPANISKSFPTQPARSPTMSSSSHSGSKRAVVRKEQAHTSSSQGMSSTTSPCVASLPSMEDRVTTSNIADTSRAPPAQHMESAEVPVAQLAAAGTQVHDAATEGQTINPTLSVRQDEKVDLLSQQIDKLSNIMDRMTQVAATNMLAFAPPQQLPVVHPSPVACPEQPAATPLPVGKKNKKKKKKNKNKWRTAAAGESAQANDNAQVSNEGRSQTVPDSKPPQRERTAGFDNRPCHTKEVDNRKTKPAHSHTWQDRRPWVAPATTAAAPTQKPNHGTPFHAGKRKRSMTETASSGPSKQHRCCK